MITETFQSLGHQSENLGRFTPISVHTTETDICILKLYYEDDHHEDLIFFRIYHNILKSRFIKNSALPE